MKHELWWVRTIPVIATHTCVVVLCVCVCVLPWGPLCKGVTFISIAAQRDGGPADLKRGTCPPPPFPIGHPPAVGGWKATGERIQRESHLSGHSLSQVCESHRTRVVLRRTHTPALREKPRGGSGNQERASSGAGEGRRRGGHSHLNRDKITRRILFLPVERRATLGEGWQKGERARRRFSSCERWVLPTFASWGGLTCMWRDDEEMCKVSITREKNSSELGENLTRVCQFQLLRFHSGLFSADRLFLQRS